MAYSELDYYSSDALDSEVSTAELFDDSCNGNTDRTHRKPDYLPKLPNTFPVCFFDAEPGQSLDNNRTKDNDRAPNGVERWTTTIRTKCFATPLREHEVERLELLKDSLAQAAKQLKPEQFKELVSTLKNEFGLVIEHSASGALAEIHLGNQTVYKEGWANSPGSREHDRIGQQFFKPDRTFDSSKLEQLKDTLLDARGRLNDREFLWFLQAINRGTSGGTNDVSKGMFPFNASDGVIKEIRVGDQIVFLEKWKDSKASRWSDKFIDDYSKHQADVSRLISDIEAARRNLTTKEFSEFAKRIENGINRPSDDVLNCMITLTSDGRVGRIGLGGETLYDEPRLLMLDYARKKMDTEEFQSFQADVDIFERRAQDRGLNDVDATYREIERLLSTFEPLVKQPLNSSNCVKLARQIIHSCAVPTDICQGRHNTCNVAVIEACIFTKYPSVAANLIADVAIYGTYTAPNGISVSISNGSRKPDFEAAVWFEEDGLRNHASQIFQLTAVNLHYAKKHHFQPGPTSYHYEQENPLDEFDTGERLYEVNRDRIDPFGKPLRKSVADTPGEVGTDWAIVGTYEIIMGWDCDPDYERMPAMILVYGKIPPLKRATEKWELEKQREADKPKDLRRRSPLCVSHTPKSHDAQRTNHIRRHPRVTLVETPEDLEGYLSQAKANGQLPVIIGVHTHHEPFFTDSGAKDRSDTGPHVVTVTDYESGKPSRVAIDNQWRKRNDYIGARMIPTEQLHSAMRPPGQ